MKTPQTLHGQLYLLAYDRRHRRFDVDRPLFSFALRAAMLTDLYLGGYIEDNADKPSCVVPPDDSVLRVIYDWIGTLNRRGWKRAITDNAQNAPKTVRDQLEADGWLTVQRRMFGAMPRCTLDDDSVVSGLAHDVSQALHNAIAGAPAAPRPLALGLLGVLGQMPTVFSFDECSRYRQELREMTFAAIEPIIALQQVIESYHENLRRQSGTF